MVLPMPNELTIKVTKEQSYGNRFIRAECLGIRADGDRDDEIASVLESIGHKIEDRHVTLKKMKDEDLTESAKAEKVLLIGVLG